MGVISWGDRKSIRYHTQIIKALIGQVGRHLVIGECEFDSAAIALILWGVRLGLPRIIIPCTDNINVSQWLESSKSHGMATCPLMRRLLHCCIDGGVEIAPRYIRSAQNLSADGSTRWSQYECEQWMYAPGIRRVDLPEL